MTTFAQLTEAVPLNPEAPFPPFPLWLEVPSAWSVLDTDPATWRRSAEQLVDSEFRGRRLPARERRGVLAVLEDYVADCQRAGAALSMLTLTRTAAGEPASLGIHLAFVDDGRPAGLAGVYDVLGRGGTTEELSTRSGPALLHRDGSSLLVPGTARVATLTNLQVFLPFPDTTWTGIVSTASAHPELTDDLDRLVRLMAASIRFGDEDEDVDSDDDEFVPAPAPGSSDSTDPTDPTDPAEPARAAGKEAAPTDGPHRPPGFAKGFPTLVRRRLERPAGE